MKERLFASDRDSKLKLEIFREFKTEKIMGYPRTTINIYHSTKFPWEEDKTANLVVSEGYRLS